MSNPSNRATGHFDEHKPLFVISVAAELASMHPQTLRTYDRLGIVSPKRTPGRGRRYSAWNIAQLQEVQRLSQEEGISLNAIKRIMELENRVKELEGQLARAKEVILKQQESANRVFATSATGEVTQLQRGQRPKPQAKTTELVLWSRSIR